MKRFSDAKAPRVYYVPNEFGGFRQIGTRAPLESLAEAGLIADLRITSLLDAVRAGGDAESHRRDLIQDIIAFRPDVVLMQHLGGTGLRDHHFRVLRSHGDFELIYHEGDPYTRFLHPLPPEARAAGRSADVVFTVGSGAFVRNFVSAGASDVRWLPHAFEQNRSAAFAQPTRHERPFDIVIVANRNSPRLRGLPNWRDRIRFVEDMQRTFADRLAVFGRGWTGPSARGPVPFEQQDEAITAGWISANWDHFADEPKYFSNRLPISLAAGSVHATTRHPGYEELFDTSTRRFLLTAPTRSGLIDSIGQYLDSSSTLDRLEAIEQGRAFAQSEFRQDELLVRMLNWRSNRVTMAAARSVLGAVGRPAS